MDQYSSLNVVGIKIITSGRICNQIDDPDADAYFLIKETRPSSNVSEFFIGYYLTEDGSWIIPTKQGHLVCGPPLTVSYANCHRIKDEIRHYVACLNS